MTMRTVVAGDVIVVAQRSACPDSYSFFADVNVGHAYQFSALDHGLDRFVESAN